MVKQEQLGQGEEGEAGQGGQGEGALVAVVEAMEMEVPHINNIRMAVSLLHCHGCKLPLKPPIFQCEADHAMCASCRGTHGQACAGAGAYVHNTVLDGVVRGTEVPCVYQTYGCTSWVVYYETPDHRRSCRFAPCFCPIPGCGHFTSPTRLAEHFSSDHGWPITEVDYAKPRKLAVPGPQDKQVLVCKAEGCVFLMSPCALGAATVVSLVCVRAPGDAAAVAPQYQCNIWAQVLGNKENLAMVTFMVASSDLASGFPAIDQTMFLAVPPVLQHGVSGEPPVLMVRIDKVGASATRSRSPAATTTSSLLRRML